MRAILVPRKLSPAQVEALRKSWENTFACHPPTVARLDAQLVEAASLVGGVAYRDGE